MNIKSIKEKLDVRRFFGQCERGLKVHVSLLFKQ